METEKREREGKREKRRRPLAMFKDAARVHRGFKKKKILRREILTESTGAS